MTAAVWVVGGPTDDDREDLRYSLRSIAANVPDITEAWIVGDVPHWFTGVRMRLDPLAEKFANQRQSLTRLVNYPGAPERFYLLNDDMYVIEPVDGRLPTCRNRSRGSAWSQAEQAAGVTLNVWHRAVIATAQWATELSGVDQYVYEAHTPLLFDTRRLAHLLAAYPADRPLAVGELYPLAGLGGTGLHCGNAKVKAADSLPAKLANPMPYLSGSPDSWAGALGDHIRETFPRPSGWEMNQARRNSGNATGLPFESSVAVH